VLGALPARQLASLSQAPGSRLTWHVLSGCWQWDAGPRPCSKSRQCRNGSPPASLILPAAPPVRVPTIGHSQRCLHSRPPMRSSPGRIIGGWRRPWISSTLSTPPPGIPTSTHAAGGHSLRRRRPGRRGPVPAERGVRHRQEGRRDPAQAHGPRLQGTAVDRDPRGLQFLRSADGWVLPMASPV